MKLDKAEILARLDAATVASHYGIAGRWGGRWLRSRSCGRDHHGTAAMGLAADGKWHCHACDDGGDLLALVARCEGLDPGADFGRVLEVAAQLAGVDLTLEVEFGAPAPAPPRKAPPAPPVLELRQRLAVAQPRARWIWERLGPMPAQCLAWRAIRNLPTRAAANVRSLGFVFPEAERGRYSRDHLPAEIAPDASAARSIWSTYCREPGYALAVRHVETGALVDVRARYYEPKPDAPKILGMLGGVTSDPRRDGGADLVGCYGWPHALEADQLVIVEGWADYLTACERWPRADVLGAVDAGQYPLVASFAARYLAERGDDGLVVLVAQHDANRPDGSPGAADRAVNLASKRAIALLGPARVRWIECAAHGTKDLNDIAQAGRLGDLPELERLA